MPNVRGSDYLNLPVVRLSLAGENRLGTSDMPDVLCRNPKGLRRARDTRRIGLAPSVFHFDVQWSVAKSTHAGNRAFRAVDRRPCDLTTFWRAVPVQRHGGT